MESYLLSLSRLSRSFPLIFRSAYPHETSSAIKQRLCSYGPTLKRIRCADSNTADRAATCVQQTAGSRVHGCHFGGAGRWIAISRVEKKDNPSGHPVPEQEGT